MEVFQIIYNLLGIVLYMTMIAGTIVGMVFLIKLLVKLFKKM